MVLVKLAKFDCIQAGVILHPGPITADEINGIIITLCIGFFMVGKKQEKLNEWILFVAEVTIPVALLGAEIDKYFPVEEFNQIGNILSAKPGVSSLYRNSCLVLIFLC